MTSLLKTQIKPMKAHTYPVQSAQNLFPLPGQGYNLRIRYRQNIPVGADGYILEPRVLTDVTQSAYAVLLNAIVLGLDTHLPVINLRR